MTLEEALLFIQASLEAKTSQKLTATEEAILKAAWENDTYSNVAESLYLSVGHVKDLAYPLWQRLSDLFGIKVTKNNFRHILKDKSVTSVPDAEEMMSSDQYDSLDSKGNILIVDDLVENLHFLTDLLTKRGYKVRSVTNGNMAVRTIRNNPPDVILLDIKMPNMDGYQVCSLLKGDAETAEIPIIFLSALDEVIDKVKAFQAGGVDYITKPFETEEVIARIQTQLTIQQQKQKLREEIERHQQTVEIVYQSRALLASLLNSSLDGIAAMQAIRNTMTGEINDFRCLVINPTLAKLFGNKKEYLMGKSVLKEQFNQLYSGLFDSLVQVVETNELLEQEFLWLNDGIQKWYYLVAVKFGDGFSINVRNITEIKKIQLYLN